MIRLLVFLLLCTAAFAQEEVTIEVDSFPPSEVYLETATGPHYLGKSGRPLKVKPPMLYDARGKPTQFTRGQLLLKSEGHQNQPVDVPGDDWKKPRLGPFRLTPNTPWIGLLDYLKAYPWAFALVAFAAVWGYGRVTHNKTPLLRSTMDPMLGRQLGSYTVIGRLGQGGMGSVYRVKDEQGAEYAAKVLYTDGLDSNSLRRFRREFKVISQLKHPALVRGFDYGEEEGLAYCVMELVTGTTLEDMIVPGGVSWEVASPWIKGILEALKCAHEARIVHRDLKPSNIMVGSRGVKLLDFGLARRHDLTAVTATGEGFGTPLYIAPEQISSRGDEIEPRSDLYSVGVIMFQLLTGLPPFDAQDPSELLAQHLAKDPPKLREAKPELPESLEVVIDTLLAKKPANRYPSAARVLEALRDLDSPDTVALKK